MSFLTLLIALVLEQARAVQSGNPVHGAMSDWVQWVRRHFDAGQTQHAAWAWGMAVVLPTVLSAAVYLLLWQVSVILAWFWVLGVLYLSLGFRQFSHHFTQIRDALAQGDEDAARRELAQWLGIETHRLTRHQVLSLTMQNGIVAAHRHVLGVVVWFVVLAALGLGPAGAVLYRLAQLVAQRWDAPGEAVNSPALADWATRWWAALDHIPVRMSALCFAVVGHFEEALSRWRSPEDSAHNSNDAVLLAAAGGALSVQWNEWTPQSGQLPTHGPSSELKVAHLASTVGLLWRSVVLWLFVLALLTVASW